MGLPGVKAAVNWHGGAHSFFSPFLVKNKKICIRQLCFWHCYLFLYS